MAEALAALQMPLSFGLLRPVAELVEDRPV
jgi:hypothetical protein